MLKIDGFPTLTKDEIKTLKRISKAKRLNVNKINDTVLTTLFRCKLVKYNYTGKKNKFGESIPDDTVSVTHEYLRYRKVIRNNFIERRLPIIISVIALIVSIIALCK